MDNAYVGKEKDPIEIQRENIGSVVSVGDQEHLNMLTPFSHSNKEQNNRGENKFLNYQYELERLFLSIDEENYPELYDEAYNRIVCTAMDTIPSKEGLTPVLNKIQDLFDEMMKENKNLEDVTLRVPLFYYLCFWYLYLWRCLLVHGSHIDELFLEHNSAEEKTLKIMSYFLERFLNDHIPLIFNEDYLNGEWGKTCLPIAFYVRWKSGAISYSFKKKSDRNKANYTAMAFYEMLTKK
ncbi:MAG: hypothetical protein J5983_07245 [Ruminococcus sp.]|nr:hypothetical protein [Ruminococcus sp.]